MNHFFNQKYLGCWLILAAVLSYTGVVNANIETKPVKSVPRAVAAGGSITEILYALGALLPPEYHRVKSVLYHH